MTKTQKAAYTRGGGKAAHDTAVNPGPDAIIVPHNGNQGENVVPALAQEEVRHLLAGEPPSDRDLSTFGEWAEHIRLLRDAYRQGGVEAVRQVFDALTESCPELAGLVSATERKTRWTVQELRATEFPDPVWTVPGLIPAGLVVLAGRPKVGKSWLALQIAHALGTGGMVFGERADQAPVLYLALEDSPRRLKDRLEKQDVPATAQIVFATEWRDLNGDGLSDLEDEIRQGGFRLVVVDTFARAVGRADQQDIADMTDMLGRLQRLAQDYNTTLLLIDHHRKSVGRLPDPVDELIGSTAKGAVADAILGLFRERGKHGATLKVTGRDIEEKDLALEWDPQCCCWQLLGEAGEVIRSTIKAEVLKAIKELTEQGDLPTTANIADHIDKDRGNVSRALADLMRTGKVVKGRKQGRQQPYYLPDYLPEYSELVQQ